LQTNRRRNSTIQSERRIYSLRACGR